MLNKFKRQMKNEKGLTLIELLAVIVIIAIIAAIAVPAIGNIIQTSREKAVISDAQNVLAAANLFFIENPEVESVTLTTDGFIPEFLDDQASLTEATVNVAVDGNTIAFKGKAGQKEIDIPATTKADLNYEDLKAKINSTP